MRHGLGCAATLPPAHGKCWRRGGDALRGAPRVVNVIAAEAVTRDGADLRGTTGETTQRTEFVNPAVIQIERPLPCAGARAGACTPIFSIGHV